VHLWPSSAASRPCPHVAGAPARRPVVHHGPARRPPQPGGSPPRHARRPRRGRGGKSSPSPERSAPHRPKSALTRGRAQTVAGIPDGGNRATRATASSAWIKMEGGQDPDQGSGRTVPVQRVLVRMVPGRARRPLGCGEDAPPRRGGGSSACRSRAGSSYTATAAVSCRCDTSAGCAYSSR
jgi:hypothetical protein